MEREDTVSIAGEHLGEILAVPANTFRRTRI